MDLSIGSQLDDKNLIVIKSILKLRKENWVWVDNQNSADVWITEIKDDFSAVISTTRWVPFVVFLTTNAAPESLDFYHHFITPPIRAGQLIKLFDLILTGLPKRKQEIARALQKQKQLLDAKKAKKTAPPPPVTVEPGEHPWVNRNIRFKGKPNFSRFPITAELAAWLEIMYQQPVSYNSMCNHLSMDSELLETVLNSAAKNNELVDEKGAALPPLIIKKNSLIGKLFGK